MAWLLYGSLIPPGPTYLLCASDWMRRRSLRELIRLRDEGVINARQFESMRREVLAWHQARWYGRMDPDEKGGPPYA